MATGKPKRVRIRLHSGHRLVELVCVVCGLSTQRRVRNGRDAALCCSRDCGFELIRRRGTETRARTLAVRTAKREFAKWARQAKPKPAKVEIIRHCRCGAVLQYRRQLCSDCLAKSKREQKRSSPSRRADKARRKALERGRLSGAERFDPLEVLARDGWRCHICGISTPRRLRGSFHDQAPEIDHIVPLAKGGAHTRLNCACSCRRCNIAKGSRPLGQLRLIA